MHFSPRSGEEIFMHFFYAFRAKRKKKIMHFFKHLCCFPQTLKKTLQWTATISHQYFFVIDRPTDVCKFPEVKFWGLYRFPFADLL